MKTKGDKAIGLLISAVSYILTITITGIFILLWKVVFWQYIGFSESFYGITTLLLMVICIFTADDIKDKIMKNRIKKRESKQSQ